MTSEDDLQSAQDRVRRLEDREDEMKNSYKEMTKKSEEKMEDYDDLAELETSDLQPLFVQVGERERKNQGEDITALKNAFPLTLRKYFLEDIEKDKNSLE